MSHLQVSSVYSVQLVAQLSSVKPPGIFHIRAGILDSDINTVPSFHIHTRSKANRLEINDD